MRITIKNIDKLVGQCMDGVLYEIDAVYEWNTFYEIVVHNEDMSGMYILKLYRKELTDEEKRQIGGDNSLYNEHIFKIEMGKHRWYLNGLNDVNEAYVKQGIGCLLEHYKLTKNK